MKKLIFFILLFALSISSDSSELLNGKFNLSIETAFASEPIINDGYLSCTQHTSCSNTYVCRVGGSTVDCYIFCDDGNVKWCGL